MPDKDSKFWIKWGFFSFFLVARRNIYLFFVFLICLVLISTADENHYLSILTIIQLSNWCVSNGMLVTWWQLLTWDLWGRNPATKTVPEHLCSALQHAQSHHSSVAHVLPEQRASHVYCCHYLNLSPHFQHSMIEYFNDEVSVFFKGGTMRFCDKIAFGIAVQSVAQVAKVQLTYWTNLLLVYSLAPLLF